MRDVYDQIRVYGRLTNPHGDREHVSSVESSFVF